MIDSPHSEFITTLTELYTLLDTLAATPPDSVHLPPHAPGAFNSDVAIAAGYAPDTVDLLSALPYLDKKLEMEWELLPSTFPVSYLEEENFDFRREMLYDEMMPPTVLRPTSSAIYGVVFIYDTRTSEYINSAQDLDHYKT